MLLYKCPGPGCDEAGQLALRDLLERWPESPICKFPPGQLTPVIARFDEMPDNYTAIVWDVVLPMESIDENLLFDFYLRHGEQYNPEKLCAVPTPTPGPATPTPSTGPSGSPAASPGTSPGSSPAVSPAASPAASTGPSPA